MRKGFKIVVVVVFALLVLSGLTLYLANRPRNPDRAEMEFLVKKHLCQNAPCEVPAGSDWYKLTKTDAGYSVEGDIELPRAALNLKVPKVYGKPTGNVKAHFIGALKLPEFKYFPTGPGVEGDFLRLRPLATTKADYIAIAAKEPADNLRIDAAILMESTIPAERAAARLFIMELGDRNTADQLEYDFMKVLNADTEDEFPAMAAVDKKLLTVVKDPKKIEIITAHWKELRRMMLRLDERRPKGEKPKFTGLYSEADIPKKK